jgi:hypothetical protein
LLRQTGLDLRPRDPIFSLGATVSPLPDFTQGRGMDDTKTPGDEVPAGTPQSGEAPCRRCKGAGRIGEETCPDCGGTGKVVVLVGDA